MTDKPLAELLEEQRPRMERVERVRALRRILSEILHRRYTDAEIRRAIKTIRHEEIVRKVRHAFESGGADEFNEQWLERLFRIMGEEKA
jgi:hypothetical protein